MNKTRRSSISVEAVASKTSFSADLVEAGIAAPQLTWQLYLLLLKVQILKLLPKNTTFENAGAHWWKTSPQVLKKKSVLDYVVIGHQNVVLLPWNWRRYQQKAKAIFANGMFPNHLLVKALKTYEAGKAALRLKFQLLCGDWLQSKPFLNSFAYEPPGRSVR